GVLERGIGEDQSVVLEPHEVCRRPVALPAEVPVVRRHDDGEAHEGDEDDDAGAGEQGDLRPLAPGEAPGLPRPAGRRGCARGTLTGRTGLRRHVDDGGRSVVHVRQPLAAASVIAWTRPSASVLPARSSTTAWLRAVPTF